ncbi:FtsK/SpoIIIE domain-containing protein [Clostridium sp. SHJSY1]|uniref:FtsK/SpoIIIE domain-containing protein n=1 Tax=Clostridium sp. SHJSY1 TaxID=2942483 RepID=UPI0028759692|nr:FtsK/SpoIIIE domain-containing protein [Clostridium sp. SHJSY1]MDS0526078.1 FtsK/SpoIIIE domain-containing protein [Clostridium sp. SHJSY1]
MVTEMLMISGVSVVYWNWDKIKIYNRWRQITQSKSQFINRLGDTLRILKIYRKEYGYAITVKLPHGYTIEDFGNDLNIFKEGLNFQSIHLKNKNYVVYMYCISLYKFKEYQTIELPPNKLLIADGIIKPIITNMNSYPHMLIGGDTGTGKSRILLLILTNLIKYCSNVELYMLQVRKNDLGVFQNCSQVKVNSKSLEEVLETLETIDKECKRRENLIDNTKGFYNIEDYNKFNTSKLKYIYVVIEEFSFLNISKGDCKEEKQIKARCLKYIKMIVNVGRSSGVFLITALQKPTNDSIPSDIKAELCTRVSLKIADDSAAKVILGNGHATKLGNRELICRTVEEEKGYSYTINHNIVMDNIRNRIVKKKKKAPPKKEEPNINDILEALNEID